LINRFNRFPDLIEYFPLYEPNPNAKKPPKPYYPTKSFFWVVFTALHPDDAKNEIETGRKRRYLKDEMEKNKTIEVDSKILDVLQGASFFSKKKGRALFKMKDRSPIKPGVKRNFREIEQGSDEKKGNESEDAKAGTHKRRKIAEPQSATKNIHVQRDQIDTYYNTVEMSAQTPDKTHDRTIGQRFEMT
jgi:hypothetical protein